MICGISLAPISRQHRVDLRDVVVAARVARIHDVQQQSRLASLRQRRLEGGHQLVGQLADETNSVGGNHGRTAGQRDAPDCWIQRGEELVGDVGIRAGQGAKQRRLAGVGVTHERERGDGNLGAHLPPGLALLLDFLEPPGEHAHALADEAAVGLELRLAGTAHADTAFLPLEVGPAAHQARGDVFQLRELDFELAFEAAGALRENIENQAVSIEHAAAGELLEVALLARRERVIDQDDVGGVVFGDGPNFVGLAAAHEEAGIGTLAAARHGGNGLGPGRDGELPELLQILGIDLCAQTQAHKDRALTAPWALEHSSCP